MTVFLHVSLALFLFASIPAYCETGSNTSQGAPVQPKLSLSLKSYYYEAQGRRWAVDDLFGFKDASANLQVLTATYTIIPALSVVATASYTRAYLETVTKTGVSFSDTIRGVADTRLVLRAPVLYSQGHLLALETGISLPTGSIDASSSRDPSTHLGYNLQIGSGTVDPITAATYLFSSGRFTHGVRAQAILRIADNKNRYRFGNEYSGNLWTEYSLIGSHLVSSLRFSAKAKGAIEGMDPTIGRNLFTEYYYHPQTSWDLTFLAKSTLPLGIAGTSLALEAGAPLLQETLNYAHYHIATEFYGSAGIQVAM
ncbi:MAG: transporter [Oligoflexia bacterium]|nr:transporter [Oligoflexia bacterium]